MLVAEADCASRWHRGERRAKSAADDASYALAAAAGAGLDQHGVADGVGLRAVKRRLLPIAVVAGTSGTPAAHQRLGSLTAHRRRIGGRRRADEGNAGVAQAWANASFSLRKPEARAPPAHRWPDRPRGCDRRADSSRAAPRRRCHRLVAGVHVARIGIGVGVHGGGADAQAARRGHAAGDLAAVEKDLGEHLVRAPLAGRNRTRCCTGARQAFIVTACPSRIGRPAGAPFAQHRRSPALAPFAAERPARGPTAVNTRPQGLRRQPRHELRRAVRQVRRGAAPACLQLKNHMPNAEIRKTPAAAPWSLASAAAPSSRRTDMAHYSPSTCGTPQAHPTRLATVCGAAAQLRPVRRARDLAGRGAARAGMQPGDRIGHAGVELRPLPGVLLRHLVGRRRGEPGEHPLECRRGGLLAGRLRHPHPAGGRAVQGDGRRAAHPVQRRCARWFIAATATRPRAC